MNKEENGIIKGKQSLHISIVGGGLVGSLAALFLARRGHNINIYEYREDIRQVKDDTSGRSINLTATARGLKALDEVGLAEDCLKFAVPVKGRMVHNNKGQTVKMIYDHNTNQCTYSLARKDINTLLLNAAELYKNITLHFNEKIIKTDLDEGVLRFQNTKTLEEKEVKTDLIIGCDGAFSIIRRNMLLKPGFDFNQTYIDLGYIELRIPPKDGDYAIPNHYIHLWPRGKFMMVALPNQEKSWTVTLLMPFEEFSRLTTVELLLDFYQKYFPDAIELIGEQNLIKDFFSSKPQSIISVKCRYYHMSSKVLLLGDAAHAMVPFFGQGMNAGFEDCSVLNSVIKKYPDDIESALREFSAIRWENVHAICDLAMYNYVEVGDLVNRNSFRLRKFLDDVLFRLFPQHWIPLYYSVSFSGMPYKKCMENRAWQDKMLNRAMFLSGALILSVSGIIGAKFFKKPLFQEFLVRNESNKIVSVFSAILKKI